MVICQPIEFTTLLIEIRQGNKTAADEAFDKEAAEAPGISVATLKRDWAFAKGFILRQLTGEKSETKFASC